jgi:hypothetical protein
MDDGRVVDLTLPGVVVDRGVVDQDVVPAVLLAHGPEAAIDASVVGNIEPEEVRAELVGGSAPCSSSRAVRIVRKPCSRSCRTTSRPIPRFAPVTRATRSYSEAAGRVCIL